MITCFIRYELEPFQTEPFERYARAWNEAIPRCGADLIGYYAPHEGSATTAYGVYNIGVTGIACHSRESGNPFAAAFEG